MKKSLQKFWVASGVLLACSGNLHSQPLSINTLAGGLQGSADGLGNGAKFNLPGGVACDSAGNIYVTDTVNGTIRKIAPSQIVNTVAGVAGISGHSDGSGTNAQFFSPQGIAIDRDGFLYVADSANATIRKISTGGAVSTLAGFAGTINSFDGAGTNANFFQPQGIAVDDGGNIYVSDTLNHTIRKMTPTGVVSTLAGLAGTPGSIDGTNSKARFNRPVGIALDSATNLFVADSLNHTIRRISSNGDVRTIAGVAGVWGNTDGTNSAARFFQPNGIVADGAGNFFVTDSGNQTIRKISPSGTNWIVTTVAGSPGMIGNADGVGENARFDFPLGIATDTEGDLQIADSGNNSIRTERAVISFLVQTSVNPPNAGTVLISPSQSRYSFGAEVSVSAMANPGYSFVGWSGDILATNLSLGLTVTNDRTLVANFIAADDLILDNADANYFGVWTIATGATDKYGSYYQYAPATINPANEARARYTPNIVTAGIYDVSIWYPQGTNRTSNAQVLIAFSDDFVQTSVDQTVGGGRWQLIAPQKEFAAGTNGFVEIENVTGETNRIVVADAVRFTYRTIPVIFSQPREQTVRADASATFQVLAAGSGNLSYQWQFNDLDIPGATQSSFTRMNVQPGDAGGYTVVISNQIATVVSDVAALMVVPPPQFGSFEILPGGNFHFTFSGDSGINYAIEASTNLTDWIVLTNVFSSDGFLEFTDPELNLKMRFYRARSLP